jgi:nucleotide-binding universal stress UspA family protein
MRDERAAARRRGSAPSVTTPLRILLAIDDSEYSAAAVQEVLARARLPGTEVRIVHVVEPLASLVAGRELGRWHSAELEALRKANLERGGAVVAKAAESLRREGVDVSTAVEEGDPKSRITDLAAAWPADVVVVGSHGRAGLDRFLLGSVSEAVARHAPCSVEIVRPRAAPKTPSTR